MWRQMDALFTDPEEAKAFWDQTGVDLLAISFGTAHGFYKTEPRLDFEVIRRRASSPTRRWSCTAARGCLMPTCARPSPAG